ncbi:MAG: serine/threonine-protein phosphatase [Actinomycetota bacterium]|nr:serine/threonine-protein phosphatase [Actinomycetota bacterium]
MTAPAISGGEARVSELRWIAAAAAVLVVLAVIDLSLPSANISGALVVAPFLASGGARPRWVGVLGGMAAAMAFGLGFADSSSGHATVVRMTVVVVGTVVATRAASVRIRRERRLVDLSTVAEAAQRAILREPPAQVGSVAVATWYQSSVRAATVGGDCYEILDTPFGARVIVGDVRGHGMASVRLAALVLGGFRVLAYMEPDVASVAHELDLLVARYAAAPTGGDVDGEEFVTAVFCEINGQDIIVANCGHPPPLLVSPNGRVQRLDASRPTPPLGLGSEPTLERITVAPSTRVLLYTDGAVEARDRSGRFFDLECAAAGLAANSPDAGDTGIARIIDQLNSHAGGHVTDDVALVLLEPLAHTSSGPASQVEGST